MCGRGKKGSVEPSNSQSGGGHKICSQEYIYRLIYAYRNAVVGEEVCGGEDLGGDRLLGVGDPVDEAADLEGLGRPQEILQSGLGDLDLAVVHVLEEVAHVLFVDLAQDDDGMLAGIALKTKKKQLNFF